MKQCVIRAVICLAMSVTSRVAAQDTTSPFGPMGGWNFSQDSIVYTSDNLWDVIDGAADLFLEYGFVDLRIGRYQRGGDAEIKVELYRFDSPADAFGMYSQERNPKYRFIDIGVQGYREEGVLNFLSGMYYIKIATHLRGKDALAGMTTLAKSLNIRLKQENSWPTPLLLLPDRQKQPNSEQYVAQNFLGYSSLGRTFVAHYGGGNGFRIFVIPLESVDSAKSVFREFMKTVPGGVFDSSAVSRYRVRDQYNGAIQLVLAGKVVAGVVGLDDPEQAEEYLRDIRERTRDN